jgi:hypothetical protein
MQTVHYMGLLRTAHCDFWDKGLCLKRTFGTKMSWLHGLDVYGVCLKIYRLFSWSGARGLTGCFGYWFTLHTTHYTLHTTHLLQSNGIEISTFST